MTRIATLPQSPGYAAALAHIADLRAEAERVHVARSVVSSRPRQRWPEAVMTALRNSIVDRAARPVRRRGAHDDVCAAC